jgi:uncharacterized protein YpmB
VIKKIIIYLTIASMLNLVGCYYQQQMSASDYDFKENEQIKIIKKHSTLYVADPFEYQLRKDTLYFLPLQTVGKNVEQIMWLGVPLNEIELIETERVDAGNTILLVSVITVGIVAIAAIIYAIALENAAYGPLFGK